MKKLIQIAPREVLLTREYLYSLASVLVMLDLSRRATVEWFANTMFRADEDGCVIMTGEGHRLFIGDDLVEEVFGEDPDFTSVSDLKRKAAHPPQRNPSGRTLNRLRWYDSVFKAAGHPVRRVDRWIEAQRMRKLLATLNPVLRGHYHKAVRDLKRRMGDRPNAILYCQKIRELRLRFAEEQARMSARRI